MQRIWWAVVVMVVLASCGPTGTAGLSPSSSARLTPVASPSPIGSTIAILYQPVLGPVLPGITFGAIHEAKVANGVITDRTVSQSTSGQLAASTNGYAVLAVPRPGLATQQNGPQPATVDLRTGAFRVYDLGPGTTICTLRGPDPTKLLVCQWTVDQSYLILDLPTGAVMAVGSIDQLHARPIAWTPRGIFFASCWPSCANATASIMDPKTLTMTTITTKAVVTAVSRRGTYLGGSENFYAADTAYCSDSLFLIRTDQPSIASGVRPGSLNPFVSQPKKDFRIVDVADDGSVLYTASDCRTPHQQPAPKSLYYFSGGQSTLQSGLDETADIYYMAAPQSPGLLLGGAIAVVARRPNGINEIDLVHLCTSDTCQPAVTTIARGDASVEAYVFSVLS